MSSGYALRARWYGQEYDFARDLPCARQLLPSEGHLIVVPCGSGRMVGMLHEMGIVATLADIEPEMVEETRRRIIAVGSTRLSVVRMDLRHPTRDSPKVNIWVPHDALLLLDRLDMGKSLGRLARLLGEGGRIVVDAALLAAGYDAHAPRYVDPVHPRGAWCRDRSIQTSAGAIARWFRTVDCGDYYSTTLRYQRAGEPVGEAIVKLQKYSYDEFCQALSAAGLRQVEAYSSYDMEPVGVSPKRVLLVAERATDGRE